MCCVCSVFCSDDYLCVVYVLYFAQMAIYVLCMFCILLRYVCMCCVYSVFCSDDYLCVVYILYFAQIIIYVLCMFCILLR